VFTALITEAFNKVLRFKKNSYLCHWIRALSLLLFLQLSDVMTEAEVEVNSTLFTLFHVGYL